MTDVGPLPADEEFVLIGQQGECQIDAAELAALRGSNVQEVLMGLALRLPRLYTRDGDLAADRYFGGELFMTPAFSARVAGASPTSLRSRREDLAG